MNCKRCGKCCFFLKEGILTPCFFLINAGHKVTACRIYPNRMNHKINKKIFCTARKNSQYDFAGCPYNTNKKILF